MQIHPLITCNRSLEHFCARIETSDFIAVDTEFIRENSFWPELCLIQIANRDHAAAIDPFAEGIDLTCLLAILVDNDDVLKVFHAGGQDIEIIFNLTGKTPYPVFDTQIGAMAIGREEQVGYSNLVKNWLGVHLDKGARFTDWSRRPLDKSQIDYAIADVTHLAAIFPAMLDKLLETGRGHWIDEEMEKLCDSSHYRQDPQLAWQRIKTSSRKANVLGNLRALAAWREHEAQTKNLPRGRIMKDDTLVDIASRPPRLQRDLSKLRGLSSVWGHNGIGARLMAALAGARPMVCTPEIPLRGQTISKEKALVVDLLKLLLKIRAKELNVATRLIARSHDLEVLLGGKQEDSPLMEGWRFESFGHDALALIEGRLGFAVRGGKLVMTKIED